MAKGITLKTKNGATGYPKSVTDLIFDNATGKTLKTLIDELKAADSATDTRTQYYKASVTDLDALNAAANIGTYNYVGNGWRGLVQVCLDHSSNVAQVALSSSSPSYDGNVLSWLAAQPCSMARVYRNGAWSHWEKVGAPVVNDLTTGGTDKALSAEMGKTLKEGLDALGPKCDQNTTNIANLQQEIDEIEPIVINGYVTNAPDEEDVTTDSNNLLKLKDRPTAVNQKGYKILRKGVSLASQLTDANTIYEVRYNHDLGGGTLTLPQGCVLEFDGGCVANGIVVGNNTRLANARMTNVALQGSFVGDFDDKDIELSTTLSTHPLAELFACGFERIRLGRDYDIPTLPNISVPNGTREIVIDGDISRAEASSRDTNYLFDLYEVQDCYIHGSGTIIGAKGIEGSNTGEWQHAINMRHCVGVKIDGLTIKDFWGDAIAVADYDSRSIDPTDWAKCNSDISISNIRISNIGRNGISVIHADNVKISNCHFENIVNAPGAAIDLEPNVGSKEVDGEYVYPKKYVQNISIDNMVVRNCKIAVCTYASYGGYINNINLSNLTTEEMVGSSVSLYMCRNVNVRNAHILGGSTSPTSIFSMSAFYSVSFDGVFCNDQNASRVFTLCGNSKGVNGVGVQISNCFVNGCNLFVQFGSQSHTPSSTDVFIKDSIIKTNGPAFDQYADTAGSAPHRLRIENCRFTNAGDSAANAVRLYYAENVRIKGCCFEEYNRAVASYHAKNVVFCENYISRTTGTGVMFSCDTTSENYTLKGNFFAPTLELDYLVDMGGVPCQLIDNIGDYALNFYRVQSTYTYNPKYENATSRFGTTGKRPVLPRQDNTIYCNTSINKMQMCIGGKWFNADGTPDGTNIKYI